MKTYNGGLKQHDNDIWRSVDGGFGVNAWVHNYYRFEDIMVSVYSEDAFNNDFSITVLKIDDLRLINDLERSKNWYGEILLEKDNITLSDVLNIINQVKGGKLKG